MNKSNANKFKPRKRLYTDHQQKSYGLNSIQRNLNKSNNNITASKRIHQELNKSFTQASNHQEIDLRESVEENNQPFYTINDKGSEELTDKHGERKQENKKKVFRYLMIEINKQSIATQANKAITLHSSLSKSKIPSSQSLRIHKIKTILVDERKQSQIVIKQKSKNRYKEYQQKNREQTVKQIIKERQNLIERRKLKIRGQNIQQRRKQKENQVGKLNRITKEFQVLSSRMKEITKDLPLEQQAQQHKRLLMEKRTFLDRLYLKNKKIGVKIICNLMNKMATSNNQMFFYNLMQKEQQSFENKQERSYIDLYS